MGIGGISGVEKTSPSDCIHMFSTRNGAKLDMRTLEKLNGKKIIYHDVPEKKQSVDMHLISFLGYLVGAGERDIVIVSKDTDYDDTIEFWKKESKSGIRRSETIAAALVSRSTKPANKANNPSGSAPRQVSVATTHASMTSDEKVALNSAVIRILHKNGYDTATAGAVASIVAKYREHPQRKTYIHGELVKQFGQDKGRKVYNVVKTLL